MNPDLTPTIWILLEAVVKGAIVIGALLTGFAYSTWFERKVIARMQVRLGPNKAGPAGLLLPAADGLKLFFKENIIPRAVDKGIFFLAPLISMTVAVLAFAVIPVGDPTEVPWREGLLQLGIADFDVALLYLLGVTSFAVYGIALAGWASNNKFALIGGLRAGAQMISYELAMGLSILGVVMIVGSLSLHEIVVWQKAHVWLVLLQPLGFVIYVITAIAETNRAPFDMPEAEQELIAGYHTEYTGMRFALFFQAEYIAMLTVCALAAALFLGGYSLPGVELPWFGDLAVFLGKVIAGMFVFVWIRATMPRLRYDQLMDFGWKVLLPLSIINVVATAVGLALYQNGVFGVIGNLSKTLGIGWALVKGMSVTFRMMFRRPVTVPYPDKKRPVAARFLGRHELKRYDNGLERCIGCSLCSAACPADAIFVVPAENTDERRFSPGERHAAVYEINMLRCIFCGFCQEACPTNAIVLEHDYELASYDRRSMIYTKDMLLVPPLPGATDTPQDTRGQDVPFRMGGMDYFTAPLDDGPDPAADGH